MDPPEPTQHSFVVRVRLEETATETGHWTWSGHVTHVPDGSRRYVRSLPDVSDFIAGYLEQMGMSFGWSGLVRKWFRRRHRADPMPPSRPHRSLLEDADDHDASQ